MAQGDHGLWLGRYNPLRSEIDISGLMAGEYELRVGVYNWQTLERMEGVDLTNGATAQSANVIPLSSGMKDATKPLVMGMGHSRVAIGDGIGCTAA